MTEFVGIRHRILVATLLAWPATALAVTTPAIVDLSTDQPVAQQPQPPAAPAPQPAQVQVKPVPSANPLWGVPIKQLSNTRERPIFSPSRRPPPPPAVVAAPPPSPPPVETPKEPERPQLTLLGTIVNGSDGYGIFMDQATKAPVRIKIGASHQGWVLRSLRVGAATLGKGINKVVIEFPKGVGQPNGLNRANPASTAIWPAPTTGSLPPLNPPPQPVSFPPREPPSGVRPPPPNGVPH
jgi:general secretion pathway protein N